MELMSARQLFRKKSFVGSLDQDRPSFKIQIDKYDQRKMFAGVDTLTLNNSKQDSSRIHQLIGNSFGVMAL